MGNLYWESQRGNVVIQCLVEKFGHSKSFSTKVLGEEIIPLILMVTEMDVALMLF